MPRLIVTRGAIAGLKRCGEFLERQDPVLAHRAAEIIDRQLARLEVMPEVGRPFALNLELRELLIGFGKSGYAALYRFEPADDADYVLAFRHQREAGY